MKQPNNDTLAPSATVPAQVIWTNGSLPEPIERELTLADIWLVIIKRKFTIMAFTLATLLVVCLYTFLKKPVYESVAEIQFDPSQSGGLGLDDVISQKLSDSDTDSRLQTQVKILESDTVSMQAIKDLGLARNPVFAKKLANQVTTPDPVLMQPRERDKLLEIFKDSEKVEVLPKTQIIELRFRSTDPKLATDTVNTMLDSYLKQNFQARYQGTLQVSEWLSKQMEDLKTNSMGAQRKLADFQKQNNILGTDENDNIVIDKLRQLNEQLTEAESDRILKEARYRLAVSGNPELIAAVVPSVTLQVLRTQQADLKAQLAQLNAKYGKGYPKVRELQEQLTGLDGSIATEVSNVGLRLRNEYLASDKAEIMLRTQFETQKQEAFKLTQSGAQFAILKHEVESSQALSDALELKLKQAGVTAGLASANITIVDRGKVPDRPVLPKIPLNIALGIIGGLFGGLVLAFVLESLDDTLRSSEEVEAVSSLPVLAVVPSARHLRTGGSDKGTSRQPVSALGTVSMQRPRSEIAEAYRAACSALLLSNVDCPVKLLVVTSALSSEGKSVTSCNLSIALAQRGGRVLLVDSDLRRSSVESQLGIKGKSTLGLSSILAGGEENEALKKPFDDLPNFSLIPAGLCPPSPAEMLASGKMKQALDRWIQEYDYVILDSAPIIPVSDTMPLAAGADSVILVVRSGVSRKKALTHVRDRLQRANVRIAGVILNDADMGVERYYSHSYGYGNYKSSYNSYYLDGNDEKN